MITIVCAAVLLVLAVCFVPHLYEVWVSVSTETRIRRWHAENRARVEAEEREQAHLAAWEQELTS